MSDLMVDEHADNHPHCQGTTVRLRADEVADNNPRMTDTMTDRIRKRLDALDKSPEAASKEAGFSRDFLRKMLKRPGSGVRSENLPALATALQTTADYLLFGTPEGETAKPDVPPVGRREVRPADIPFPHRMPNDVPVFGTAAGSHLRGAFMMDTVNIIDYVRRPPALLGAMNAYALYIEGLSMVPEHNQGDLRFVHPDRPPRVGDSVIVQIKTHEHADMEAMIGHYLGRTEKFVKIGKLNPEATVELKRETVVALHKVLTLNELFGV